MCEITARRTLIRQRTTDVRSSSFSSSSMSSLLKLFEPLKLRPQDKKNPTRQKKQMSTGQKKTHPTKKTSPTRQKKQGPPNKKNPTRQKKQAPPDKKNKPHPTKKTNPTRQKKTKLVFSVWWFFFCRVGFFVLISAYPPGPVLTQEYHQTWVGANSISAYPPWPRFDTRIPPDRGRR